MKRLQAASLIAIVSVCGLGGLFARSEWKLRSLMRRSEYAVAPTMPRFQNAREMEKWRSGIQHRERRFAQLWLSRQQRDVSEELLPYLRDPLAGLRQRAVQALGRLESFKAQVPLQAMLKTAQSNEAAHREPQVPSLLIKLALGRIQARNLTGRARVEALAESVGLSWGEVVLLSGKIKAPNSSDQGDQANQIVRETINLLYTMGQQGQSIESLSSRLTLSPAQKVLLQASSLPDDQEIKLILDYLSHVQMLDGDTYNLADHLMGLGSDAVNATTELLTQMRQHPEGYPQQFNYKVLFIVASGFNNRSVLPLLEQFEKSDKPYIRSQAKTAQRLIKSQTAVPIFPA